ncbi:MAG TPA: ATP-binding protein [Phycisphaerales bacterium]|nr:ATP-binding protein [Phycisphaerales bacterium]
MSDPIYLAGAREMVLGISRRLGFKEAPATQIALAVDEALANVINHGYDRQNDKPIWIRIWPKTDGHTPGLRLMIEDEARQIDPDSICGRDLDDVKPGGLGVHIIREVMDTVTYERRDKVGMRLTLIKKLDSECTHQTETSNG